MVFRDSRMAQRCKTCAHPQVKAINRAALQGRSLRAIAEQHGPLSHVSLSRHLEGCLKVELGAVIQQHKNNQAVDVKAEFEEQLAFAKSLRRAAEQYLTSDTDPLKLVLIPRADEIDVTYYDFQDKTEKGEPKKKTSNLHVLLAKVEGGLNAEADKVVIKHVDMRKFALDAINTTDTCIDKFAKLAGLYTQDKPNPLSDTDLAKKYLQLWQAEGGDLESGIGHALRYHPKADIAELGTVG